MTSLEFRNSYLILLFYDNICIYISVIRVICLSPMRIFSLCNRTQRTSPWYGLLVSRAFEIQLEISYEKFQQSLCGKHNFCCICVNRPILSKLDLICKQINLIMAIFDRNSDEYREKFFFSDTPLWISECSTIVFDVLISTCKLDWILNSSHFLQHLARPLWTNTSNFLPLFWLGITMKLHKTALYSKSCRLKLHNLT